MADLAGEMHISQELHLHHLLAFALTGIAAAAVDIKGKMLGLETAHLAQRLVRIEIPDLVVCLDIGDGIAAR